MLIECPLAVGNTVCSGCGLLGLFLLDLLVGLGLGDDVCQEFKVLDTSDCVGCKVVSVFLVPGKSMNAYQRHGIECSCEVCAPT